MIIVRYCLSYKLIEVIGDAGRKSVLMFYQMSVRLAPLSTRSMHACFTLLSEITITSEH